MAETRNAEEAKDQRQKGMNYLGGKFRQGRRIAEIIQPHLDGADAYIEPFCGAMGSASRVAALYDGPMALSDQHGPLMVMWQQAILHGWEPPSSMTAEQYADIKARQDPKDPVTAFCGFGCSFAATYFSSYARTTTRGDHCLQSRNGVLRKVAALRRRSVDQLFLIHADYQVYANTTNAVFYLDPPYAGRTKQSAFAFNHEQFWEFARELSAKNTVFISEFVFPDDFESVHNFGDTVVRHHQGKGSDGTAEHLVRMRR